ncbi:MAG: hypothetical protein ACI3YU_10615 [Segatella copri]
MKCVKCKTQLNDFECNAIIPNVCPSCGASLMIDNCLEMETMEDTLRIMVQRYGIDLLRDATRTIGYFSDLAPLLKKEKKMLQCLLSCEGHVSLINALVVSKSEQRKTMQRIILKMTDEMFVSKEIAEATVMSFWTAISGEKVISLSPQAIPTVMQKKRSIVMGGILVAGILVAAFAYLILKPLSNGMTKSECASIYAEGNDSYETGDYRNAIVSLSMLPSDFRNYDEAQVILKDSERAYCSSIIDAVKSYINNQNFSAAILLLNEARDLLPYNTELTGEYSEVVSFYKAFVLDEAAAFISANDYPAAIRLLCTACDMVSSDAELNEKYLEYAEYYSISVIQMAKDLYEEYNYESILAAEKMLEYALSVIPDSIAVQRELEYYKACEPISLLDLSDDPSSQHDVSTYSFTYVENFKDATAVGYHFAIAPSGWYENSHPYGWSDTYSFAHYSWLLDYQYSKITGVFLFSKEYENTKANVDLTLRSSIGAECKWNITNSSDISTFEMDLKGCNTIEISLRQSDIGGTFAYLADVYVWK